MDDAEKKLLDLMERIIEGSATSAEQDEFERLGNAHRELAPLIAKQMRIHNLLQRYSDETKHRASRRYLNVGVKSHRTSLGTFPNVVQFAVHRWKWSVAAALIIGIGVIGWGRIHNPKLDDGVLAEVVGDIPTKWSDGTTAASNGERQIRSGRLELKCGTINLRFRSGASVSASGDVSMQIESGMLVRLNSGQATANVPETAHGFTIKTRDAEVIDLGTEFGVLARRGGSTDVIVFVGKVDLKPTSGLNSQQIRLTQGEGARIDHLGSVGRIVEVRYDLNSNHWSTDRLFSGKTTIKGVSDNVQPSDSTSYYAIVPNGLTEDVKAYVDRPHEWNGVTVNGLPEFLIGADYVRTFNDYKYSNELEIKVELARPANLYVFFDQRVPARSG